MPASPPLILASASPRRLELLKQLNVTPSRVVAPQVDETPRRGVLPKAYVERLAKEKALQVAAQHPEAIILAADTAVACGRRILPQAGDEKTAWACLKLLSGRRHRVYTAIHVVANGKHTSDCVMSVVMFARLSEKDIADYIAGGEWQGKAGGYAIQGRASAFIPWIRGSYSSIVGLPLHETQQLLRQAGIIS